MTGTIDRQTFQRLTLIYLIDQLPDGVRSSYRLQKLLYCATRDVDPKPFTFHFSRQGPYSRDVSVQLLHMFEDDLVQRQVLRNGASAEGRWKAWPGETWRELCDAFAEGLPAHAEAIRLSATHFGCLRCRELDENLCRDPRLQGMRRGRVLLRGHSGSSVSVTLDDEQAEDLEIMTRPELLRSMAELNRAVTETDFETSKVRRISSLDDYFI
ncbi:MAG: hypothetical protein OXP68_03840 [Anaerolineaceae bacterium]|nr:hypothetical protein [Anaerolineaceae bacterium]MDE0327934.1 hypothetical protein [Anaerolineaceae bacterium]